MAKGDGGGKKTVTAPYMREMLSYGGGAVRNEQRRVVVAGSEYRSQR